MRWPFHQLSVCSFSRKSFLSKQKQQKDLRWESLKSQPAHGNRSPAKRKEGTVNPTSSGKLKQYRGENNTEATFNDSHLSPIKSQITNYLELEIVRDLSSVQIFLLLQN